METLNPVPRIDLKGFQQNDVNLKKDNFGCCIENYLERGKYRNGE